MKVAWVSSFPKNSIGENIFLRKQIASLSLLGAQVVICPTGDLFSPVRYSLARTSVKRCADSADIVHAQWGSGCGYLVSGLHGPKVLTLRGSDWYGSSGVGPVFSQFRSWIASTLSKRILDNFDKVIVVSERMADEVSKKIHPTKVSVCPSGIDLAFFKPLPMQHARALLGFPDAVEPWVLFVSVRGDNHIKRPKLAEEAFQVCKHMIPGVRFVKVSGISADKVPLYMSASNVLLLTSMHEGWPNVVKEALACNTPFVSTDVSDLKSLSIKTSRCRVVPSTAIALGNALADVLKTDIDENLRRLVEPMGLEQTAERLFNVYKSL